MILGKSSMIDVNWQMRVSHCNCFGIHQGFSIFWQSNVHTRMLALNHIEILLFFFFLSTLQDWICQITLAKGLQKIYDRKMYSEKGFEKEIVYTHTHAYTYTTTHTYIHIHAHIHAYTPWKKSLFSKLIKIFGGTHSPLLRIRVPTPHSLEKEHLILYFSKKKH